MLTNALLSFDLSQIEVLIIVMALIFILGWPLEWVPIVLIIVPILIPLLDKMGINLTWFGILVAVNLQTAWLSPPVALSAYFLKGVVPDWDLKGHLPRHDAVHGHPVDRPGPDHAVPADRPVASGLHVRGIERSRRHADLP